MIGLRLILSWLPKVLVAVALALLLHGTVERERLFVLLALCIALRAWFLWREWRKPRPGDAVWARLEREDLELEWIEEKSEAAGADGGEFSGEAETMPDEAELERRRARPGWREGFARCHSRRADLDIQSEAIGLILLPPCAFLLALGLTSPVVTWTGSDRGPATLGLALGLGLHFAPNLLPARSPGWRIWSRVVLWAALLIPLVWLGKTRHPYLLVSGAEHRRLIAERVWELGFSIEAGRHAGLLIDYARDLERDARWPDAATVYRRALALDAYLIEGHEGLARALAAAGEEPAAEEARRAAVAAKAGRLGVRASDAAAAQAVEDDGGVADPKGALPQFDWTRAERLQICLVPVGNVPRALLDRAGRALGRELGVEVFVWAEPRPLPEPGRKAGLLGTQQWSPVTLMHGFIDHLNAEARSRRGAGGAWQFILVTDADLYAPDSNYVFAVSFAVHGVVSFARFGADGSEQQAARLAKQLTATAIKCFGVGQAARPDCVTAYVRTLAELDRKPARPAEAVRADYLRRVAVWELDPTVEPRPPD